MTELEKCMAGELYNCHDEIFLQYKKQAKELLDIYNRLTYDQKEEKKGILHKLFGGIGTNVSVGAPFLCDYGCNIITGSNVSINMNCSFIDCNQIKIGNNVMIASGNNITPIITQEWRPYQTGPRRAESTSARYMRCRLKSGTDAGSAVASSYFPGLKSGLAV